jgi:2-dehydro-3-deoxyphosphogluconate aldolase/(4S)-4-hydroxy-2-oxoglutarate aldolase
MGGLCYLRGISAPYRHLGLHYIPLGGVNEGNLAEYLSVPDVLAVGGSWLVPAAQLADEDWQAFEALAARASKVVEAAQPPQEGR